MVRRRPSPTRSKPACGWLAWLACCVLAILPAAGVRLCFGADHIAVAVGNLEECPGDHADGMPCTDVSLDVPDCHDGTGTDARADSPAQPMWLPRHARAPWRAGEFDPCRRPAPDGHRVAQWQRRRCTVLLI